MTNTTSTSTRQILAATFSAPDGATRAAAAVVSSHPEKIGNTAVLYVRPDGTPKFIESKDWGAGRGALLGGVIGLIGGPLGMIAGSGLGVLATRLRDMGFKNDQLGELSASLEQNHSCVVFEIANDGVPAARRVLEAMSADEVVTAPVDSDVADLFAGEQAPVVDDE
ncbi:DUF1269 domain-containing protein [Propionibacterium sp.]|uniref:DUF1269 domain-containing protein n=1 Tax=Propionibacterium sp. TaxID=1977903 RepID=UPI0039EC2C29